MEETVLAGDVNVTVSLTKRELEILRLVEAGKTSQEAATELSCSKRTVDYHLAKIYEKLQVSNRMQALRKAAALGLLSSAPPA